MVVDAVVFDNVAAVMVDNFFFVFFKRPMTIGTFSNFLTDTEGSDKGDPEIIAWDFRQRGDSVQCFAVKKNTIYRYDFTFNLSYTLVTTKQVFINFDKFDGTNYTVLATPKEVIIACGDCTIPAVYFFNNELDSFVTSDGGAAEFPISNPSGKKFHLAVDYKSEVRQTQVLVGAQARVDLITRQSDFNGYERFSV